MAALVSADWVEERVGDPSILLLDPRPPMKYLQGHLKNAVNLPVSKAFDAESRLGSKRDLEGLVGAAGLDGTRIPIVYDAYDGQRGAMLAWVLDYLGYPRVQVLDVFFERWRTEGREVFYRPVPARPAQFSARLHPEIRAGLDEIRNDPRLKLLDARSRDEYGGQVDLDGKPGHIPGAINIPWQELVGARDEAVVDRNRAEVLLQAAGLNRDDQVVTYCRTGPRAALGYLVLRQLGYSVRLFDGSFAEWARHDLPLEV